MGAVLVINTSPQGLQHSHISLQINQLTKSDLLSIFLLSCLHYCFVSGQIWNCFIAKSGSSQPSLCMLHNHKFVPFAACFSSSQSHPSVRSFCGSRTWNAFTWICSAVAATWPACRAVSPPTPNACWASLRVPPSWPWDDWAFSLSLPSMHWYDFKKCPLTFMNTQDFSTCVSNCLHNSL